MALLAAALCLPSCAPAGDADVVKEVTKLLKAQVGETVVLSYIQKEGAPAKLNADAIVDLKKAGASDAVILALMGGAVAVPVASGDYPFDLDENHQVLKPVIHGPMAVFPIVRKGPAVKGDYLTLDEAVNQKLVTIREKGDGSVPIVIIVNNGKLPIYISAGEIIIGGKQDRIISYDVIVHPSRELPVEVRCVEHGRWQGGQVEFSSSPVMGGRATKSAAQFADQATVWREVAEQNETLAAESSTGSYKASLTKPEIEKAYEEYAKAILSTLEDRNVVGMIVAINGKVHAIEIFGSPRLFAQLKGKLLKGYVLDAMGEKDEKAPPPAKDKIVSFYQDTMKAQAQELKKYDENTNMKRESGAANASECLDKDGGSLHRSLLAK